MRWRGSKSPRVNVANVVELAHIADWDPDGTSENWRPCRFGPRRSHLLMQPAGSMTPGNASLAVVPFLAQPPERGPTKVQDNSRTAGADWHINESQNRNGTCSEEG